MICDLLGLGIMFRLRRGGKEKIEFKREEKKKEKGGKE